MVLGRDACCQALASRDALCAGRFFVIASSTKIYRHPDCRARLPRREKCSYYPTVALAEAARFALASCAGQPYGCAPLDAAAGLAAQAAVMIQDGALGSSSRADLARKLAVTPRHLRRVFKMELEVSPSPSHRPAGCRSRNSSSPTPGSQSRISPLPAGSEASGDSTRSFAKTTVSVR